MLTQDEVEKSLRHLCVVKNNYLADKAKSKSYILKFNDHLAFENTGDRIELELSLRLLKTLLYGKVHKKNIVRFTIDLTGLLVMPLMGGVVRGVESMGVY